MRGGSIVRTQIQSLTQSAYKHFAQNWTLWSCTCSICVCVQKPTISVAPSLVSVTSSLLLSIHLEFFLQHLWSSYFIYSYLLFIEAVSHYALAVLEIAVYIRLDSVSQRCFCICLCLWSVWLKSMNHLTASLNGSNSLKFHFILRWTLTFLYIFLCNFCLVNKCPNLASWITVIDVERISILYLSI